MSEAARDHSANEASAPIVIGRYALFDELAAGGMATVHLGRLLGPVGFGRTVAIKRLHAHLLRDEELITMFTDEARIVARIAHPNVVPMVDVVQNDEGLFLVMEYVHGESLARLMRNARRLGEPIPARIIAAVICAVLHGLHAAHETKGASGELLHVVHRDVSPQNVIVGADGVARVLDFGVAKAAGRVQVTREGQIKGKLTYMAPEQIRGNADRRSDVFAASVVLWEMLAGRRFHDGATDVDIVMRVVSGEFPPPSAFDPSVTPALDAIVMRGLSADLGRRYATAREMAFELERAAGVAPPSEVGEWVEHLASEVLALRASLVSEMERAANDLVAQPSLAPPGRPGRAAGALLGAGEASSQEAPSTSAVFPHAPGAVPGSSAGAPRRVVVTVIACSAVLALAGLGLGAYALRARSASPTGAETATSTAGSVTSAGSPVASAPTSASATSATVASAPPVARAGATASAPSSDPRPRATGAPRAVTPPPRVTAAPAVKPRSCDPPYTVDEVGHRHYKPECD
ncbi:MAG: hypothetical protein JWP97_2142 [Labilithrix sp.]|nr:hypothetical protein [Labilithrix sp.]